MIDRKALIIIVFVSFLLAVTLSPKITTSRSRDSIASTVEYDPWIDANDDGVIDGSDVVIVIEKVPSYGEQITKASITYDSGWINITDKAGQHFNITHNLNSTDIIVDITGKTTMDGEVHQRHLGLTGYTPGWSRTYGGPNEDYASSVVRTSDGGYAIAGHTYSFGVDLSDFWLIKTDIFGNIQGNWTYGGTSLDYAYSIIQTSDGGYALAGETWSFGAGDADFWLVKTDSCGNLLWNKTYGGASIDIAYSLVQTSDGGYALGGYTLSFGAGWTDFWLIKTYANGTMQWNKTYGDENSDEAYCMLQTDDGGYAMGGEKSGDFWLVKANSLGDMEWNRTYDGSGWEDVPKSLIQTSDGGYALAGHAYYYGAGESDFWLVKTDANGNAQWNKTYGGTGYDYAQSVVQGSDGGFAIAGMTSSFGVGSYDFWLVRTDISGNAQWNKTYGSTGDDRAQCVVQTGDGGYLLVGQKESLGFMNHDLFLVKTSIEFGLAWVDSTADTITLYRGATDAYWNYVRVRIWKIKETP